MKCDELVAAVRKRLEPAKCTSRFAALIQAIKIVRELSPMDLRTAKGWVEDWWRELGLHELTEHPYDPIGEVRTMFEQALRQAHNLGIRIMVTHAIGTGGHTTIKAEDQLSYARVEDT